MRELLSRRAFLGAAGLGALGLAARRSASGAVSAKDRPNILFIMADDHTSQAWGCYGSRLAKFAPTGHIDGLARDGALLRNCFCTNSICVPSRASILTGQYSHVSGVKGLSDRLDPAVDNVAKRLQAAGYETAIVGKWHLKEPPAGFDYFNVLHGQGRYKNPILFEKGKDWKRGGEERPGHSTDVITDSALGWLAGRKRPDAPFCLMVHFKAVHEPFYSPDRYRALLEGQTMPEPEDLLADEAPRDRRFSGWPLEKLAERFQGRPNNYSPPPLDVKGLNPKEARQATYQKFVKDYLRAVAGINDNVGRLLARLDERKIARDTVVVYTSDQGYFLGEHNMFDKRFMLEESLRMPFVVRYPREIAAGAKLDDIVLNIDFAELLLDYAGAEIPKSMQGRSFRQNLRGKTPKDWRDAMYYHYWSGAKDRPAHYGVRTHRHKLIYYYDLVGSGKRPEECWELYDLQNDPRELANVYDDPKHKPAIAKLKKQLDELRREFGDTTEP